MRQTRADTKVQFRDAKSQARHASLDRQRLAKPKRRRYCVKAVSTGQAKSCIQQLSIIDAVRLRTARRLLPSQSWSPIRASAALNLIENPSPSALGSRHKVSRLWVDHGYPVCRRGDRQASDDRPQTLCRASFPALPQRVMGCFAQPGDGDETDHRGGHNVGRGRHFRPGLINQPLRYERCEAAENRHRQRVGRRHPG